MRYATKKQNPFVLNAVIGSAGLFIGSLVMLAVVEPGLIQHTAVMVRMAIFGR